MKRVLLIEDDLDLASAVTEELKHALFEVDHAADGVKGVERAREGGFVLVILDLTLPGLEGIEVCRQIRAFDTHTPIIIVTSRASEAEKVLLLELGADDYVTKPFSIVELRARVKAAVRRGGVSQQNTQSESPILIGGDLVLDAAKQRVTRDGVEIPLTTYELGYLQTLMESPGRVFSREALFRQVGGYDAGDYAHSVSAAMSRLRAKLELDPANPNYILTARGAGYKFNDEL